jgi:hypothetical protein
MVDGDKHPPPGLHMWIQCDGLHKASRGKVEAICGRVKRVFRRGLFLPETIPRVYGALRQNDCRIVFCNAHAQRVMMIEHSLQRR